MSTVVLFHHVLGATTGLAEIADRLRGHGHEVMVPDLFEGRSFATIDDGVAHVESVGFDTIVDRGVAAVEEIDEPLIVIGVSLGVLPAQKIAQTDGRVIAAVLIDAAVPVSSFGESWPETVAVRLHLGAADPFVEEDLDAAHELADAARDGALQLYDTANHLAIDPSAPGYDGAISERVLTDVEELLDRIRAADT